MSHTATLLLALHFVFQLTAHTGWIERKKKHQKNTNLQLCGRSGKY